MRKRVYDLAGVLGKGVKARTSCIEERNVRICLLTAAYACSISLAAVSPRAHTCTVSHHPLLDNSSTVRLMLHMASTTRHGSSWRIMLSGRERAMGLHVLACASQS